MNSYRHNTRAVVKLGQADTMATPHTYSDDQLFIGPVEFI